MLEECRDELGDKEAASRKLEMAAAQKGLHYHLGKEVSALELPAALAYSISH